MGYNPSHFKNCGKQCPVEMVSWHEAIKYANELSKIEHLSPCFDCQGKGASVICALKKEYGTPQDCSGYRLPTEAEWEMAARAGTNTAYYNKRESTGSGSDGSLAPIAWYANNSSASYDGGVDCSDWFDGADKCGSQPYGKKSPNDFDLYDIAGNVDEWTMDFYQSTYPDGTESEPLVDPRGAEQGSSHVIRGGSWASLAGKCRSASRGQASAGSRTNQIGFRLAKSE
jgi:formylglycine-generating enzyme required for sulfatase activity